MNNPPRMPFDAVILGGFVAFCDIDLNKFEFSSSINKKLWAFVKSELIAEGVVTRPPSGREGDRLRWKEPALRL